MSPFYTATDHFVLLPAIMLSLFACAVLMLDVFGRRTGKHQLWLLIFTLCGLAFTGAALWKQQISLPNSGTLIAFGGALRLDGFSLFFNWLFLAASTLVCLFAWRFLQQVEEPLGEFYALILFAQTGMFFLAAGADLITLFLGLETLSVCFYILVGFLRTDARSSEASIKYLLVGAFSSAILLYGFSILYGLAGSTLLSDIGAALLQRPTTDPLILIGVAASGIGMLFKVAAVPFHAWAPDAYEGSPAPVTSYLAVGSTAASFALLLRVLLGPLEPLRSVWEGPLVAVAIATLTLGNLAALTQSNVKRLLAYSSIGHAGYVLLGLIAGTQRGLEAVGIYLLVYLFMTLGAFLILSLLQRQNEASDAPAEDIDDFAGLFERHPAHALWMLLFLVSLAGVPPTAGFIGKYAIFAALIESGHYWLAVVGGLYVAVSLYYYFRLVRAMFSGQSLAPAALVSNRAASRALAATIAVTVIGGIFPEPLLQLARTIGGGLR
jgi:NADH-quinone oxidoreductase subunit N